MSHKYIRSSSNPGAIINSDFDSLKAYKAKKEAIENQRKEIDQMKQDLGEIKEMLKLIIGGNK